MLCPLPFVENGGHCVLVLQEEIVDKHGHKLDGDADPKAKNGCDHRDTAEWKAAHQKPSVTRAVAKEKPMDEIKHPEVVPPAPVVTTASVGVPLDVPPNIMALMPKDGSASIITVLLALIVTAGAVAWKFGPGWMEAKRERETKQAELEEKRIDQQSSQHIECKVARDQVEARVASVESTATGLSARVDELAGKVEQNGSLSVGGDDLAEKVGKLEKAIKALKKAKS
jgi:hypothetical protein